MTLADIVNELADAVEARAKEGKHFGMCLIPEGLIEFIPQVNALLKEISTARRLQPNAGHTITEALTPWSAALLNSMPAFIRKQLLLEAQASDDKAQLNQIETERLLADLVRVELNKRRDAAPKDPSTGRRFDAKFSPVCFYLGYQARSSMPSQFDSNLAFALGQAAGALVATEASGYMATVHCLTSPVAQWRLAGVPLFSMMSADRRSGVSVAVIRPSQVELHSSAFKRFALVRDKFKLAEMYCNPGPMQFHGPLAHGPSPGRLTAEHSGRAEQLREVEQVCRELSAACWAGCPADVLQTALVGLRALQTTLHVIDERGLAHASTPLPNHMHTHIATLSAEEIARRDN
jgi:diphosphate--fructose-6-phosphate 1-phosphotransferase